MRSSIHGPEVFLLASKKPRIKELIAASASMSAEQIKALQEKPDVIRGLLAINKLDKASVSLSVATRLADMMSESGNKTPSILDELCEIYQIIAGDQIVTFGSGLLEVKHHWYWGILQSGKILISNNQLKLTQLAVDNIKSASAFIKNGNVCDLTDLEYIRRSKL